MSHTFINFVCVGAGSCLGGMARYATGLWLGSVLSAPFWVATLVVNVVGCFLIGLVSGFVSSLAPQVAETSRLLLAVGFCGGFTTFSSFAAENLQLLRAGNAAMFVICTLVSVVLGVVMVLAGWMLSR